MFSVSVQNRRGVRYSRPVVCAMCHLPPFPPFLIALLLLMVGGGFLNNPPSSPFGRHSIDFVAGMTFSFFLKVTITGSWLQIGQLTGFFCITSSLLV